MGKKPMSAAGSFLFYGVLPSWGIPGVLDWWQHRRTHIEKPDHGGVPESALHLVMLGEGSIPLGILVLAEVNPLVLTLLTGSALVHELTAHRDLTVATRSKRTISATEQQVHTFLEMAPFLVALLAGLDAWPAWRELPKSERWILQRKKSPMTPRYVAALCLLTGVGGLVHLEEFWRCVKGRRQDAA